MTTSWRARFAVTACGVVAAAVVLLVTGHSRSTGAYAGAITAVAALSWFVSDVVPYITPVSWEILRPPSLRSGRGDDIRAMRLSHRLTELGEPHSDPHKIWQLLVEIIDDRLHVRHNIDRVTDPIAAASTLGPRLSDFVAGQPATSALRTPEYLSAVVSDIEEL